MFDLRYAPLGYQQIPAFSTLQALTVPAGATMALIQPEAQAVRFRDDGIAPTASVGQPIAAGSLLEYAGNLSALQFFPQVANAILNVSYYRVVG